MTLKKMQKTVKKKVTLGGIGLQTGERVNVTIKKAPADAGVVFVRTDLEGAPSIKLAPENVIDAAHRTSLSDGTVTVQTVEHLPSTARGSKSSTPR